jgi:hypothetical protein
LLLLFLLLPTGPGATAINHNSYYIPQPLRFCLAALFV